MNKSIIVNFLAITISAALVASCAGAPKPAGEGKGQAAASAASPSSPAQAAPGPQAATQAPPATKPPAAAAKPGTTAPGKGQQAAAPAPSAAPAAKIPEQPPPQPSAYLAAALSALTNRSLPSGARLAVFRTAGRPLAAAEICIAGGAGLAPRGEEGAIALGLALAAQGKAGEAPGSLAKRLDKAGARVELRQLSDDAIALEIIAPPEAVAGLIGDLLGAMADPAFASAGFPAESFDAVMKSFRMARFREESDPMILAGEKLRAEVYAGHSYALPPLGTSASLLSLDAKEIAALWKAEVGAERISIAAAGDIDADLIAAHAAPALEKLGRKDKATEADAAPGLPLRAALVLSPMPGVQGAYLRADFSAPDVANADYPALALGLVMLDDLLSSGLGGATSLACEAYTKLSLASVPSGTITVERAAAASGAKAAVEGAIGVIVSGQCLSPSGPGRAPIAASLDAYKLRAITRIYSRGSSAASLADCMARDLAAGGDGSAWFRLADRIRAVKAADVPRVMRNRLVDGAIAWSIVAAPDEIEALKALESSGAKQP